jgi:hypothetical protein
MLSTRKALSLGLVLSTACLVSTGCTTSHRYELSAVENLSIGRSTRESVREALGEPSPSAAFRDVQSLFYLSESSTPLPRLPWSILCWPIYASLDREVYVFNGRFDDRGVLVEGGLTISFFHFRRSVLLLVNLEDVWELPLEGQELEMLRRIQTRGIRVRIRTESQLVPLEELPLDRGK